MAWICDKNGNHRCEIKKLTYNGTFMEVSSITVTVESPAPIAFAIGDYIDWDYDGLRYTLDTAAGVEKQATRNSVGNAFIYENLVFLSPLKAAENADFFDVILGNTNDFLTNTEFSFYGTAWDYAKRLEANLCRLYGSGTWKVRIWTNGTCYDATPATGLDTGAWENKLVDVAGIKCLGGFQQIYDLWGCAYVFSVVSGVNYVDFYDDFETRQEGGMDKIFAYGKGNGLYKIRHTPDADHVLVTRLRPYGSGDNLPPNYYLNSEDYHVDGNESSELAISHLMLPASQWTKDDVKHPANAYLEQNTDLYGVREGVVLWDGSDPELGEIKPSIYGLTIQVLLNLMASGDSYRPDEAKWPDTTQRIDKIVTGAAPVDNGVKNEAGYDFTEVESSGSLAAHSFGTSGAYIDVEFNDLVMGTTPSVSHLAEFRIVPTSENKVAASFDVQASVASAIRAVNAYLTPYVGGVKISDATYPCTVTEEAISNTVEGITYTKRYKISLLDSTGNPIVFSSMYTGNVTFRIVSHIDFTGNPTGFPVVRNEYAVSFNLLRGNKAIDEYFSVTIPQIGFDLSAAVANGAKLCMRSGANQPREFQIIPSSVRYLPDTDTWFVRCKRSVDQSISTYFPNSNSVIAAGDEYYFTGIAMPPLYVEIAAQKLLTAATAWLALHSNPRMLSAVDVDNKIMAVEEIVLKEGMSLTLSDTDLGITPQNQESRVIDNIRIEEGSDPIRTFTITLRDKKEKSSLDAAIRGATSNLATNASVSEAVNAATGTGHGSLTGRDMPNQHPISAITGLEEALLSSGFFEYDPVPGVVKLKSDYDYLGPKKGLVFDAYAVGATVPDFVDLCVKTVQSGNTTQRVLYSNLPLITKGDQIVENGTPGGGTPTGVSYLHELLDVNISNPTNGQILAYNSTLQKWVNADAPEDSVQKVAGVSPDANGDIPADNLKTALGLGSAAYKDTSYFAAASHTHSISEVSGLDANLTTISDALQSLQAQLDAVASKDCFDEIVASVISSDMVAAIEAYAERYYLTDGVFFYIETINGTPCVRLNAPFITDGDQIVLNGTPGSGGGSGVTLYSYDQVKAMTADVDLTVPSAWAMHQMYAEIFGGASIVLTSGNYTNYVNTTNFPGLNAVGTVTSVVVGTGLTGGTITGSGTISIDATYLGYIAHGENAYNSLTIVSDALQSLQSQIDSVASRDNFDELTASAVFSDIVSASAMYAGALTLGGYSFNGADINEAIAKANTAYQKPSTGIPNADIESPWVKVGTTQISLGGQQTSLAGLVNVTMSGKLTIGSAEIEWVPGENGNPGYLKVNSAFVTEGDQIIISGTPGGGGSAAAYLYELDDVSDALSSPATGDVLQYNGTEWVGVSASTIGGVTSVVGLTGNISTTQIADALTAAGYALTDTIVTSLPWSSITSKPTTLSGYGITDAATSSEMTTVSAVLQSLQSQIDSVSARDAFDELVCTAVFAGTLSASDAFLNHITGDLTGNAATASRLVSASYSAGGTYQPVYFSYGLPVACSYAIYSALYNGTAGRLAYYSGANLVSDYYGSVGSGVNPMYLSSGVPTASSDTAGSAALPVYLNAGTITACTASSMFSALGSNTVNNLEVTIFGQLRYISDLYATYDGEGEVIGDKFTIVSNALRSLQGQIDSVAARQGFDTLNVANGYFDMISVGGAVGGNLHVIGTFSTTGDQVVTSDATKKTCLRDISLSVEQIAGAPAVTFDWKAGGHSFGSIAQYWKGVLPESVLGPEGDYSLAYGQLALVSSIVLARRETEQDREIKRLKERVALLENKVEQLTMN